MTRTLRIWIRSRRLAAIEADYAALVAKLPQQMDAFDEREQRRHVLALRIAQMRVDIAAIQKGGEAFGSYW